MKVYKVELCIVDFDELGPDGISCVLENARYPNHCLNPGVMKIEAREIGEWDDDHPLNNRATKEAEFRRLFG